MHACITQMLERLGVVDHVEDEAWNAHGNVATGDATNYLGVDAGTFFVGVDPDADTPIGDVPGIWGSATGGNGGVVGMGFIPSLSAFRAGEVTTGRGGGTDSWAPGQIGYGSIGQGTDVWCPGDYTTGIGTAVWSVNNQSNSIGGNVYNYGVAGTTLIGYNLDATSSVSQGTVVGNGIDVFGTSVTFPLVIGNTIDLSSPYSAAIGIEIDVGESGTAGNPTNMLAAGLYLAVDAQNSIVIGSGVNAGNKLENTVRDSLFMGVASDQPSLILRNQTTGGGAGTYSNVGIIEQDPKSTLDVGGSVGYKYKHISESVDGDPYVIGANDNELVFFVNPNGSLNMTINLPDISTIDRRMYYFRHVGTSATKTVRLQPNVVAGDEIDSTSLDGTTTTGTFDINRGNSAQIVADGTSSPAVWRII